MPSSTHYRIRVHPEAVRQMARLPGHVRQRVRRLVASLADNPRPTEAIELRDLPGRYRIRIDRWRLIYRVDDEVLVVVILRAGPKTGPEFYADLPDA
ncbi:MAG: type II toxin-antitoxin system RelE/ParE family toxin [Armatimonadetes bacterium]|jgi:mRNA interferase RelE/StbE|nr:type II toxin-antitoxin system RelE/ParE family toxin [Armatimonadota bacterium]